MDTTRLQDAYARLLDAAAHAVQRADDTPAPPGGGWDADRILTHIALAAAATLATAATVASGARATYDNRLSHDDCTTSRVCTHTVGTPTCRTGSGARARRCARWGQR